MVNEGLQGLAPPGQTTQNLKRPPSTSTTSLSGTTEGSFVDFKVLQEVSNFQKEVRDLRQHILVERVRLREDRIALGETRQRASDAAANFVAAVRAAQEGGRYADSEQLERLYEDVLRTRDTYGTAETEYGQQEAIFYEEERSFNSKDWKLTQLENDLYSLLDEAETHDPARALPPSSSSPVEWQREQPIASGRPKTEESRLLAEYRSQLGKAEMLEERLHDLSSEQNEHIEERRQRQSQNLDIDPKNQAFLDQFTAIYDQTFQELQGVRVNIQAQLKRISQAGYDVNQSPSQTQEPDPPYPLTPVPATPRNRSPAKSESAVAQMRGQFDTMRQRIGEWILNNLGSSPIERARHKAALEDESLDNDDWWRLVQQFWYQDAMSQADAKQDTEFIRIAESYSFLDSSKSMQLGTANGSFDMKPTLSELFGGHTAKAMSQVTDSSEHGFEQLDSATEPTSVSFSSTLTSDSPPREANIEFDDDKVSSNSIQTLWDKPESSLERKLEQDLNLKGARPYWSSIDLLENQANYLQPPPTPSIVFSDSSGN